MKNLLDSTNIGTIFLSNDLRIKRFTQSATKLINLIPSDVGRPLSDIVSKLNHKNLYTDARHVLDTLIYKETEVESNDKKTYLMRIMPYRTLDNLIDGVVITFTDLTAARQASEELLDLEAARVPVALVTVDQNLEVVETNRFFCGYFGISKENALGKPIASLWDEDEHAHGLLNAIRGLMEHDNPVQDYEMEHTFPHVGRKKLLVNALKISRGREEKQLMLIVIEEKG